MNVDHAKCSPTEAGSFLIRRRDEAIAAGAQCEQLVRLRKLTGRKSEAAMWLAVRPDDPESLIDIINDPESEILAEIDPAKRTPSEAGLFLIRRREAAVAAGAPRQAVVQLFRSARLWVEWDDEGRAFLTRQPAKRLRTERPEQSREPESWWAASPVDSQFICIIDDPTTEILGQVVDAPFDSAGYSSVGLSPTTTPSDSRREDAMARPARRARKSTLPGRSGIQPGMAPRSR